MDKKKAAVGQLETAIQLWFNGGDIVSMHTLATAAHDCLSAMSAKAGKRSFYEEWLEEQPDEIAARFVYFQNFIKHGSFEPDERVEHSVYHTEALMGFTIDCYEFVFSSATPVMHLFELRFAMEDPVRRNHPFLLSIKERFGHDAENITRADFLKESLPIFEKLAVDGSVPHIQFP